MNIFFDNLIHRFSGKYTFTVLRYLNKYKICKPTNLLYHDTFEYRVKCFTYKFILEAFCLYYILKCPALFDILQHKLNHIRLLIISFFRSYHQISTDTMMHTIPNTNKDLYICYNLVHRYALVQL